MRQIYPRHFPSIVEVRTVDGRILREEVLTNRGTAERPLSDAEVQVKYDLNARRLGPGADVLAERIARVIDRPVRGRPAHRCERCLPAGARHVWFLRSEAVTAS